MQLRVQKNASNVPDDNKQGKANESLVICIDGYENKNNSNKKKTQAKESLLFINIFPLLIASFMGKS